MEKILALFTLFILIQPAKAQRLTDTIKLNQIGFYPEAQKLQWYRIVLPAGSL